MSSIRLQSNDISLGLGPHALLAAFGDKQHLRELAPNLAHSFIVKNETQRRKSDIRV